MSDTVLSRHEMDSSLVPEPLTYELLRPAELPDAAPVLVWLHGGNGAGTFSDYVRPALEACWASGALPPLAVVAPHSGRSFWMDGIGERAAWETLLATELLPHVRASHAVGDLTVVAGISMGGMGALRLAFRHPELFAAVAALEPAIESTPDWAEVPMRDTAYRVDVVKELFGDPVDAEVFAHNHPAQVLLEHAVDIAAAGLAVYFECGDEDMLDLHHGAEALHRLMWDIGLRHEYRSVRGGNHVGASIGPRMLDALGFLGRALAEPEPDPQLARMVELCLAGHDESGFRRSTIVTGPAGPIEVHEYGDGEPVVMIPSLGRGAADFADLAQRLARAGYHAIYPEPRGIGGSTGDLTALSMADLAADAAAVIHAVADGPATVVGHAFGNRVARMTATEYPHLVDSVVLLCCGGLVQPAPEHARALHQVFDIELSDEEHLAAVELAFFAPGNDPSVWFEGWHGLVAACQGAATVNQPVEHWWGAGGKDLFVVQPLQDVMAVPENARLICEEFADRARMVTVDRAGHALLPEQPEAVEVAVRSWLARSR